MLAREIKWDRLDDAEKKKRLKNRFKLFYILRFLWKENNKEVNQLYAILFPSKSKKGGNKTLFYAVMRMEAPKNFAKWETLSKQLQELTDINEGYFTGEREIRIIPSSREEDDLWKNYVASRSAGVRGKSTAEKRLEGEIKSKIRLFLQEPKIRETSEIFKRLVYFAQFGQKRGSVTGEEILQKIEMEISNTTELKLGGVSAERLETHYHKVRTHAEHIWAMIVLKKWQS